MPIDPTKLDPVDIARLGLVDGAVLLGPDGRCHAFGVILDGAATDHGDPARGSRYNSAVRYHKGMRSTVLSSEITTSSESRCSVPETQGASG